jgi:hypothetical protein
LYVDYMPNYRAIQPYIPKRRTTAMCADPNLDRGAGTKLPHVWPESDARSIHKFNLSTMPPRSYEAYEGRSDD